MNSTEVYKIRKMPKKNFSSVNAKKIKRIALLLQPGMAFDREIARGVGDFIHGHKGWVIQLDPMLEVTLETLQHWNPDGVIMDVDTPGLDEVLQLTGVPKVGVGPYDPNLEALGIPMVTSNQHEIGRVAAKYFIGLGFKDFAFCGGNESRAWCKQRRDGFAEELECAGYGMHEFKLPWTEKLSMPDAINAVGKWMRNLPKPCGVFVFFDGWARWVLDACVIENIKVPQEMAVLGVDNDRWLCELSQPSLSSIDANIRNAGYTAAKILNDLLDGSEAAPAVTQMAPLKVFSRDSTDLLAFDEPEVAFAIRYIREHACDPITPDDVLYITGMSKSTAYRKFMKAIGRSIHSEIQLTQMNKVKELLTTTNLSITNVAKQSGFENIRYFTQVFKDATGYTPTEYRRTQSTPDVTAK